MIQSSKYKNVSVSPSVDEPISVPGEETSRELYQTYENVNSNPQMMTYYPKYAYLDSVIDFNKKPNINIFVDVKGCCTSMYSEWCVRHVLESSKCDRHINLDMFSSLLYFIAFHKKYAARHDFKFNIIFFMEQGKSKYHLNIYKDYKSNRLNSDFFGLDLESRERFFQILDKNYGLCEYVINRIPNCSFYCLKYCEADFIPYYIMKNKFSDEYMNDSINIVYSRDKDMLQCLEFKNTYQFYKASYKDQSRMISEDDLYKHFVKNEECTSIKNGAKWFPLLLALGGDNADGVPGIKGLGAKTLWKNIDLIMKAYKYDPDVMYKRTMEGENLLMESWEHNSTETTKKIFGNPEILKRNMKLVSYRALSDYVDGGFPLHAVETKQYIDKIWNFDKKLSGPNVLWNTLKSKGLDDIVTLNVVQECFYDA